MNRKEIIKLLNELQTDFREKLNERDIKISKLERTLAFLSKHTADEIVPGNTTCYFSTNGYFTYILDGFVETSKNFVLPGSYARIYADEEEREKRKPIYQVYTSNEETALIKITREEETMYVQLYKLSGDVANVTDVVNALTEEK